MAVYFWAVVKDRPVSWAAKLENWLPDLLPALFPRQCTVSRRMRQPSVVRLMTAVEEHLLGLLLISRDWVRTIDAKPLAVSHVSKDPDAAWGRFARRWLKGYKLHAVWGQGPMPTAWALTPQNVSEKTMARYLIASYLGKATCWATPNLTWATCMIWRPRMAISWSCKRRVIAAKAVWVIGAKAPVISDRSSS